ncbi:MAG: hypothetical protein K2N56_07125 [Oscillospiraceae bacterium]|nr:hypothetical protein [Oscillospiraceae bacterium]
MIRFFIKNGNNSLRFDAPTDELFDHLGSIGIGKDIPITSSGEISVKFYPTDEADKIAKVVCDRLLPEDKISDVNQLCEKLDGQWRISAEEFEEAINKVNAHGAAEIGEVYEYLIMQDGQSMNSIGM